MKGQNLSFKAIASCKFLNTDEQENIWDFCMRKVLKPNMDILYLSGVCPQWWQISSGSCSGVGTCSGFYGFSGGTDRRDDLWKLFGWNSSYGSHTQVGRYIHKNDNLMSVFFFVLLLNMITNQNSNTLAIFQLSLTIHKH